jgi:sugar lactone lactonase YvrE
MLHRCNFWRAKLRRAAAWVWVLPLAVLLQSCTLVQAQPALAAPAGQTSAASDLLIYADALAAGWEDWSWDTTVNLSDNAPVHSGALALSARFDKPWAGLYLRATSPVALANYTHLRFWLHGGAQGGQRVVVMANQNAAAAVEVIAQANTWTQHSVALADLGRPPALADLFWQDATGGSQPAFSLDDISLMGADSTDDFPDANADAVVGSLDRPAGIALAPSGRAFAALHGDPTTGRQGAIWSWPSAGAMMSGAAPDIVLGRAGAAQVGNPESVAVDRQNRLYVADTYAHRVLVFANITGSGQQPVAVFGSQGTSTGLENKFQFTRGLAVDSQDHLFVTDEFNNRILVYNLPITSNNPSPIAQYTELNGPRAVAVDGSGDIYIADSENAVVKVFEGPAAPGTHSTPTRSIGQPHAATNCPSTGANTAAITLACPIDLNLDSGGRLYVADTPNHRILGFRPDASTPAVVYGQADFSGYLPNRGGAASSNALHSPLGMASDSEGNLYAADFENDRILRFDASTRSGPTNAIELTVDAAAQRRTINPLIYGMNFAPEALADELALPVNRWGGNATTRYNYLTDIANHALDWYFQNIKESDATNLPADSAANRLIDQNRRTGTQTLLTLPMTGWVSNGVDRACGYDITKYGPQPEVEPYGGKCGKGVRADGSRITNNTPSDTSISAPPSFAAGWVNFLRARYGAAADGGVRFYNLDNEPDIWFETHRDIKPTGWKYQEFRNDTIAYAAAIKAADPGAELLGPVVNGWTYYWHGAYDGQREDWNTPDDRLANGDVPFVPWYLQQMRQYEQQNGVRLLDYLDLHYYPQAAGVALAPAGNAGTQALRLRSTRALWDPSYVDESWIKDAGPDGGIVQLIPRMRAWVNAHYPGTKLAVTEYNWGALDHINGALAQAEVLGVFGREGLDLATLWGPPASTDPGAFAFRIYRNYDGQGGRFGDVSVQALSADVDKLAIFAAERSSDGSLTAVVINKTDGPLTGALTFANRPLDAGGEWRRYDDADLTKITAPQSFSLSGGKAELIFSAQSITLLVLRAPTAPAAQHLYLPAVRR